MKVEIRHKVEVFDSPQVGCATYHPEDGLIYITDGSYMGDYGRVSNFWKWRKINKTGSLGKKGKGYWRFGSKEIQKLIDENDPQNS